jgi:hypothetical protein
MPPGVAVFPPRRSAMPVYHDGHLATSPRNKLPPSASLDAHYQVAFVLVHFRVPKFSKISLHNIQLFNSSFSDSAM